MTPARRGHRNSSDKRVWDRGLYFEKIAVDRRMRTSFMRRTLLSIDPLTRARRGRDQRRARAATIIISSGSIRTIEAHGPRQRSGAIVTVDGAETWSSWYNQSTAQIYHVAADRRIPYWVTGSQQDSGAVGSPSRSRQSESQSRLGRLVLRRRVRLHGARSVHPEILFGGTVSRCNVVTGETKKRYA